MKSTKIFSLILVVVMCFSMLASCGLFGGNDNGGEQGGNNGGGNNNGGEQGGEDGGTTFTPAETYKDPDIYDTIFNGGSVTTVKNDNVGGGTVSNVPYAGEAGKDYSDEKVYTYKDYLAGMSGLNWNPLSWETNDDSYVLGFLTMGFYDFAINEDKTGYSIIPEMAAEMPVDVTADYVGSYGVKEGDTAKAWKIALNPNAKWQDGTPITADDYIYSMQQQLDPKALYRRADSYYAGDFQLVNAKEYLYAGQKIWNDAYQDGFAGEEGGDRSALDVAAATINGAPAKIAIGKGLSWLGGNSLAAYVGAYGDAYFDTAAYESLAALADDNGLVDINAESVALLEQVISLPAWGEGADFVISYMVYEYEYPVLSWDQVGLLKIDDYTLVYITVAPTEEAAFYVPYNLSSTWLVNKDLFEASKTYYDAEGNTTTADKAVSITSSYFTTLEGTISYGPYKMTAFQEGKAIKFERNDNWYGYSDGKHVGQFQTDIIDVSVISDDKTALQVFLQGDLAGKGLSSEYFEDYASSDRLVYTPESYTTKLTFNTNYESLVALGNNQQLLAVSEFRNAFGLAVDKEAFVSAYTSAGEAGFGLLNYQYCYDPFTGSIYRDSDHAKKALVEYYGIEYGEGKDFENLEEAYNAMTGYDLDAAKALMQEAYDKAVAAKIYDGTSPVVLEILVYDSEEIYVKMVNFFNEALQAATEGTDFEGLVSINLKIDADYYDTMYGGGAAMIFSTWGGAAMSPFTMINQVYTDNAEGEGNQMEYGFETDKIMVTINVNGTDITASLKDWADWCGSTKVVALEEALGLFADYNYDTRCAIFSIVEKVYLQGYATFGLYYRNSASLVSYKINNGSDDYLQIVGRGGIRHITYNYDDATWETVKGNFDYKSSK